MQRVLDLDLDAFVYGSENWRSPDAPRLDVAEHPPWDLAKAAAFLEAQCLLTGPIPGFAVEQHGELFFRWRDAIDSGLLVPPFHVTHVDAHADLGLGDSGYVYLLTELLHKPVHDRREPETGDTGLGDGNYLAFAIANQWIADLAYVLGGRWDDGDEEMDYVWRPGDLLPHLFEDFDPDTRIISLPVLEPRNLRESGPYTDRLRPLSRERPVPFSWEIYRDFQAAQPYDLICLARSPAYTPEAADGLYDEIRARFIDEGKLAG
jgi:hypothetical protein